MADPAIVAIEAALIERARTWAAGQSPAVPIALPNVAFAEPAPSQAARWARADFMPVPTVETGISFDAHLQHVGLLQVTVFMADGAGEPKLARLAASVIAYFPRGLKMARDGITVRIDRPSWRGPLIIANGWASIPVTVPFLSFSRPG